MLLSWRFSQVPTLEKVYFFQNSMRTMLGQNAASQSVQVVLRTPQVQGKATCWLVEGHLQTGSIRLTLILDPCPTMTDQLSAMMISLVVMITAAIITYISADESWVVMTNGL